MKMNDLSYFNKIFRLRLTVFASQSISLEQCHHSQRKWRLCLWHYDEPNSSMIQTHQHHLLWIHVYPSTLRTV